MKKFIITVMVLAVLCALGVLCWKAIKYNKGDDFSPVAGFEAPVQEPTATPTAALIVVKVKDMLVTKNETLIALIGDRDLDFLYGESLPGVLTVLDDAISFEFDNETVTAAEFFAISEGGEWFRLVYDSTLNKLRVERRVEEREQFLEDKSRTELCLTWTGVENTEPYDSELFLSAQECLLSYLQKVLFEGAYQEVYQSLDHEAAARILNETASYEQFVWYADNLRSIIESKVSEQMVPTFLGCDVRAGYCYSGLQFGNYNPDNGKYRKIIEVWCVLFLPEEEGEKEEREVLEEDEELLGFWLFGPGVLDVMLDEE